MSALTPLFRRAHKIMVASGARRTAAALALVGAGILDTGCATGYYDLTDPQRNPYIYYYRNYPYSGGYGGRGSGNTYYNYYYNMPAPGHHHR